jgi:cysteine desulfurase
MMMYLDYAATTPPYEEVIQVVSEVMREHYGNPSSIHGVGHQAERLLFKSKEVIAGLLEVKPSEIIYTSGGTESNNLAIKGIAHTYRSRGNHLITSQIEHASVTEAFKQLEAEGFRVTYLPVDSTGQVKVSELTAAIHEDTILVSIMHVNNEVGRIQPIAEIGELLAGYPKILFHVDAVQAVGKLPFYPVKLGIDLCSASAHKFRGPKGVGFLYRREGIQLQPQLVGGGQEFGLRSGTENVPLLVGMAKALRIATQALSDHIEQKYRFRRILVEGISTIPGLRLSGSARPEDMAPHIVHFMYPGMKAEVVVHALEQEQIYISTKSACASGEEEPSKVLLAMGYDRRCAVSGLRVSYSEEYTEQDSIFLVQKLKEVMNRLSSTTRGSAVRKGRK